MKQSPLLQLLVGLALVCIGGYLFLNSVSITSGFFGVTFGSFRLSGGLVVLPFLLGVFWLFWNRKSIGAKIVTIAGLIFILLSIIMETRLVFRQTSLFLYLLMLILIVGGAAMVLQVLLTGGKDSDKKE